MKRIVIAPRAGWEAEAEELGFLHHTPNGEPYWAEDRYYEFSLEQVLEVERASAELHELCLGAVEAVIQGKRYAELGIPDEASYLIERSWENDAPSVYGRFDLSYDGTAPPKLLEYNAQTPTSLIEAAVAQWHWLQAVFPDSDQFNSIHEKLIGQWAMLRPYLNGDRVYFASLADAEDICTINYLRDTAKQAGLTTEYMGVTEIGWHDEAKQFIDQQGQRISTAFLLYPWEWMLREGFAPQILSDHGSVQWIEPAWKMVLSNKGILPILWELNTDHPNLLPAYREDYLFGKREYVAKPLLSREGANITIHSPYEPASTSGEYGEEGFVYQEFAPLPNFDGWRPVIGSWMIGGTPAGMGIREGSGPITDNLSRFVPHRIA